MNSSTGLQQIVSHAKAYGFLYPSSEIYDGLQGVYDYGPYGVVLKRNIQLFWWRSMTWLHGNIVGLDAAVLMHRRVWEASGHVAGFHDWMVDNKDSRKRYRVDVLVEERVATLRGEGREVEAAALLDRMNSCLAQRDGEGLTALLVWADIRCPQSKSAAWSQAREFNLMFATDLGAECGEEGRVYLRPETAQGVFVNFLQVQKSARQRLPFGIAQVGKAFRNELIARQFIFRMKEFEQMELQFFTSPTESERYFTYWQGRRRDWYHALGISSDRLRIKTHDRLAHYARGAVDIEYLFPFGYKEVEGIHNRGDFDLGQHQEYSGKKLTYFDPVGHGAYLPHVVETSAGSDRVLLMVLCEAWRQDGVGDRVRTYLSLPAALAPITVAVLPLLQKEGLVSVAKAIYEELCYDFAAVYVSAGSIGKRYVRQDVIGTPFCITVDEQTLEDGTVTVRERDSMEQCRVGREALHGFLSEQTSMGSLLRRLGR